MSKLSSSFLLIFALSLMKTCHGVMNLRLQDNIIVSPFTPIDEYQKINFLLIPQLAQYYKDNNMKVVFVPGLYGGAASIPLAERKRLVKAWEEQANCLGFDLIVEVGALPFVDTLEMARYCSTLNVTAITAFAEIIYQATKLPEALKDLQRICDAAGNKLPLLYHSPVVDQKIKTDEIFLGAMDGCVSCFIGVLTDINEFLDIKAAVKSVAGYQFWAYGLDNIAASLKVGMNASETVNLFPDLTRKIKDAVDNCRLEQAADIQQELNRRMYTISNFNGGAVAAATRHYLELIKAAFELLTGFDMGYRYPLERPNSTVINRMRSKMLDLGLCLYSSDNNN